MVWWGIIVGAVLGLFLDSALGGFGLGLFAGAVFGWLAGYTLRAAVRAEIRAALAKASPPAPVSAPSALPQAQTLPQAQADVPPVAEPAPPLAEPAGTAEAPPVPEASAAPRQSAILAAVREWLLGGNTIVRAGIAILFVGLSFLVRFAVASGWFPIELRLAAVGATGAALVALGFNRRLARPAFGLAVQGAGVAVLYLTVFAAARFYGLLPPVPAFALMVVFCALGCALALLQDSQRMAFVSFAGGFAVPVLLGGSSETPLPLFTYGTVLNLAIMAIAGRRSWRSLNLLGFGATFAIAILWSLTSYQPQHYALCQIFLAATVVIYLTTAVLYAHNTPGRFGNVADGTLLFGPAIAGFGLQAALVERFEYGSALAALGFAAIYVGFALLCLRRRREEMRVMIECLGAIALGFVTLAIPLAFDAQWTSSAWALEGAGAFWVGLRQARWMQRLFGLALQGLAVLVYLATLGDNVSAVPLLNRDTMGGLMVTLPLLATAWWLRRPLPHSGSPLAARYAGAEFALRNAVFLGGFVLACLTMPVEITRSLPSEIAGLPGEPVLAQYLRRLVLMLGVLLAMAASALVGRRQGWAVALWPARASLPVLALGLLLEVVDGRYVTLWPDIAFFAAAIALHLHLLHAQDRAAAGEAADKAEDKAGALPAWQGLVHAGTVWLGLDFLANAIYLAIDRAQLWHTSWAGVIHLVSAVAVLAGLTIWAGRAARGEASSRRWPLDGHALSYAWTAAVPIALATFGGALITALFAQGVTDPLPYVPLVNPVDLSLGLALVALLGWRRMVAVLRPQPGGAALVTGDGGAYAGALLLFVIVNTVWLRTAHHWLGVAWSGEALFASFAVQTGLAILWTLLAMALMIAAHRRRHRVVWLSGAALLVLVVIKLVFVDLSNSGGVERVVAFIAVGMLMLVIGYFAPLPPAGEAPATETP